ncbi:ABC transporter [Bifidobacterium bohemicum]|uniref:ABC transporter, ATP-binding protein n=2 Tax=Bifidobacterium bohemicum TaxID=638617 RepID=A0A086ZK41_9BIFI|nr:ABC transporter, ATP-binding protein [Bifidobacterium bohemicum DSM 22767]SCB84186.1 ABC transporter [Bifidobacterium bohemicum]
MVGNMDEKRTGILRGVGITRSFGRHSALAGVNVEVEAGRCLAIIGGSGSGKSTLVRILLGLDSPTSGSVDYRGLPVSGPRSAGYRALRRESGLVFQNPFASLDPRWTVGRSIAEPLAIGGGHSGDNSSDHAVSGRKNTDGWSARLGGLFGMGGRRRLSHDRLRGRAARALALTGLDPAEFLDRYPADLSGGQAQRVAIARAVVAEPNIIAADEPMSAIDVAARLQILDAFAAIREQRPNTALIIVSHDLGVVQHIADRILVLHEGLIEQEGTVAEVLGNPTSDYTRQLVAAAQW